MTANEPINIIAPPKEINPMSMEPLETLLGLWRQEKLDPDQAIGQMLQHLIAQAREIKQLKEQSSGRSASKKQ